MSNINIHNADVIEWLKNYNGPKFHSVISDPPYGLAFMGKTWDKFTPIEYQNWVTEWASELIKHLYPGSVCMFFGGTRTYHRLATGLEDAGFEIFDSMIWCYGSGFPKSYNISKGIDNKFGLEREVVGTKISQGGRSGNTSSVGQYLIDSGKEIEITQPNHPLAHQYNGYGTALKPAFEPMVLCRKPRGKETFVDCALNYGSGSLNVDGGRIKTQDETRRAKSGYQQNGYVGGKYLPELYNAFENRENLGRFPANLGLICDCEKEPCECIERELDQQAGYLIPVGTAKKTTHDSGMFGIGQPGMIYKDGTNASRFFYTAKSSRKERNLGLDHLSNNHPTVKPIKLIEYLATMLKPPVDDSSILIPFSGSGSEIIGAMFAGWNIINAIEIDAGYCNIAENRISYWKQFSTYADGLKGNRG